jgi:hypothetical protein
MKKMYFALLMLGLVLSSCGSGPDARADDLCDCFKDAGVDFDGIEDPNDIEKIVNKMSKKKGQKCVLAVLEGVEEDISDMDDDETGEYFRDFIKSMLDTECVSEGMEDLEFGDMKKELKREIKRMKRRMKDGDDDYSYGDASSDAGPDYYYDDYGTEQREASSDQAKDYEGYYDEEGYGDYGTTEEGEAEDYYEEELESIDFDF